MLSYKALWNKLKKEIKETTSERMFSTWIEPVKPIALNRNSLVLELPSQFFYEWIETHYKNQFEKIIKEKLKEEIKIQFTIGIEKASSKVEKITEHKKEVPTQKKTNLNKKHVFSNFIEGGCNQFAKAASTSVSEFPGQKGFNPLVIYGGGGAGKNPPSQRYRKSNKRKPSEAKHRRGHKRKIYNRFYFKHTKKQHNHLFTIL